MSIFLINTLETCHSFIQLLINVFQIKGSFPYGFHASTEPLLGVSLMPLVSHVLLS